MQQRKTINQYGFYRGVQSTPEVVANNNREEAERRDFDVRFDAITALMDKLGVIYRVWMCARSDVARLRASDVWLTPPSLQTTSAFHDFEEHTKEAMARVAASKGDYIRESAVLVAACNDCVEKCPSVGSALLRCVADIGSNNDRLVDNMHETRPS
jgi:hypothetical protein